MPIGKNALKRVSNNGYSNVKTSAPDMENSEIEVEVKPTAVKKDKKSTAPKTSEKKVEAKGSTKSTVTKKVASTKKSSEEKYEPTKKARNTKSAKESEKNVSNPDGFVRFAFGDELPVHLL